MEHTSILDTCRNDDAYILVDDISKALKNARSPKDKKRLIKEFSELDFRNDYRLNDLILDNPYVFDWRAIYYKYRDDKDMDIVIKKMLDNTEMSFDRWLGIYWSSMDAKDTKLSALIIGKLKTFKDDESLWIEVYRDLKKEKAIESNPLLMQAIKDMEALFGTAYYDETDNDYIDNTSINNGAIKQDCDYDSGDYYYDNPLL